VAMSFRKEKKFRVTIPDFYAFKNQLLNQGMSPLYKPRKINSIYFDTSNLKMFFDSEEGTVPRKKIRVRWYNEEQNFTFEKKISSIEGRYKTTNTLKHIAQDGEILDEHYFDCQYGLVIPTLMVSYERSYFIFRSMRITFDDNITYKTKKTDFRRVYKDPERVIEIKIPANCSDDYIENQVPYATSRFSKFSRGLMLCSGNLNEF
jgi:SPX domain protein involved in polyphosphate accumulation